MDRTPRARLLALKPTLDRLEVRQMLSGDVARSLGQAPPVVLATAVPLPTPGAERDALAWSLVRQGEAAPAGPWGPLAKALGRHTVGDVVRVGIGTLLTRALDHHPRWATQVGLLLASGTTLGTPPAGASALAAHATMTPRPDLDAYAWTLAGPRSYARAARLTVLADALRRCPVAAVAGPGLGAVLVMELTRRPVYTAKHGLSAMLKPPAVVPTGPATPATPLAPPTPSTPPDVPAVPTGPIAGPPTGGVPIVTTNQTVAVGATFAATLAGASGQDVTYTITPQPLPAHMGFDRGTGAFTFVPAPDQVSTYHFTIAAQDAAGTTLAVDQLTLQVVRQARPQTTVRGVVVDEAGEPLTDVPVMMGTITTTTDARGRFTLQGVPPTPGPLTIDGMHDDRMMLMGPTDQLLGHPTYDAVDNIVPAPIVLPRIDVAHATDFGTLDPGQAHDLTSPVLPGVVLHVPAGSAMTMEGAPFRGKLALTPLDADQLRPFLPPYVTPGTLFIGVDGADLMFEGPATLTLPNSFGLAPGDVIGLLSMNMVNGGFDVTAHLQVSADGTRLETIDGGIHGSSCLIPFIGVDGQGNPITLCTCGQETANAAAGNGSGGGGGFGDMMILNSDVGLVTGEFFEDHALVAYQSQGVGRTIDLEYSSLQADPKPVAQFTTMTQVGSSASGVTSVTAGLIVGGVSQGSAVTYTSPGLTSGETFRVLAQADATALATGIYDADLVLGMVYGGGMPPTTMTADYTTSLNVVNASASPYGAGFSIGGLQKITGSAGGPVLITAGSQGTERYAFRPAGPITDLATIDANGTARILSNDGMGDLTVPNSGASAISSPVDAVAGDFDEDGKTDLAEVAGSGVKILLANSSAGFNLGNAYTLATTALTAVTGNFTGHAGATLDLAVLLANGTVVVLPGNGNGTFNSGAATTTSLTGGSISGAGSMAAADFDGDGDTDLAVANTGNSKPQVLLSNGSGGFATPVSYTLTAGAQSRVVVGDFTNDGKLDLACVNGTKLTMMVGDGAGGFTESGITQPFSGVGIAKGMVAGDFYGDGQLAVAVLVNDSGGVNGYAVLSGSTGGSWSAPVIYQGNPSDPTTVTTKTLAGGDLNGDGRPDLALAYGALSLAFTNPDANQTEPALSVSAAGTSVSVVVAGSFIGGTLGDRYVGPMGDTSTLVHNGGGTWTRTYPDGRTIGFDSSGREVTDTDRNGNTTTFTYVASGAAAGALQTVTDPVGLRTTLAYNGSGKLSTVTDPASRVTSFVLDGSGNLTSITDPDGAVRQYAYATPANHRMTGGTDPRSGVTTITYDTFGRFVSEALPGGLGTTTAAGADVHGLLAAGGSGTLPTMDNYTGALTDPNAHVTTLAFDTMGHPTTTQDGLGHTTSFTRDMNGWPTAVMDPLSQTTSYTYDSRGNVTLMTRADSSTAQVAYDASFSQPTRVQDFRGLVTSFTLDAHGNVTRQTDPDTGHSDFTYNAAGQVLTATDRNSHTTSFAYDAYGRVTTITYPGAGTPQVVLTYDSAGNVTRVLDELAHATTLTYDNAGRLRTSQNPIEATAGKVTTYTYDASGNRTAVTDALNHTVTSTYDARNRLTAVTDALSHTVTYTYDGRNLATVTDPLSHTTTFLYDAADRQTGVIDALSRRTTWTYDNAGQLTQVTDANNHTTTYAYDVLGRVTTMTSPGTAPNPAGFGSPIAVVTVYAYDADGNMTAVTDPLGHITTSTYDNLNRLTAVTDALSHVTSFGYDAAGNRTTVTDPLSHITTLVYDERNRVLSQTEPSGGGTTTFTYDAHSRLTSLTDPVGNVTTYTYDNADRLTVTTDPRSKLTTYAYDVVNNLTQVTDRLGRIILYGYDNANRETTETWQPAGGGSTLRIVTYTYDNANRLTGVVDPDSQYAYVYDNANQLTTVNDAGTTGLPQVTLTYGYDNIGNRTGLSDSQGGTATYTYDERNELTSLTQAISGFATKLVTMSYDAAGRMTTISRSIAGGGSQIDGSYRYDNANRMTTITHDVSGGANLVSFSYSYDNANRLTAEKINNATVSYTYDNSGQLTAASGARTESYSWDANGNSTLSGTTTTTGNRVTAVTGYTVVYDDEGNMTSKTETGTGKVTTYAYDNRDRMTGVTRKASGGSVEFQATYTYDALDRRIGFKVDADGAGAGSPVQTWTLYDGVNSYADFNGSGTLTERYLDGLGVDELLARTDGSGTTSWYLTDRQGSVRAIANTSGTLIYTTGYDSFGKKINESGSGGDRWGYTGREHDTGTGLRYQRARYFDEVLDRWTQEDPARLLYDINTYRYTNNDPIGFMDRTGLFGDPGRPQRPVPILEIDPDTGQLMGDVPQKVDLSWDCIPLRQVLKEIQNSIDERERIMVRADDEGQGRDAGHVKRKRLEVEFRNKIKERMKNLNCDGNNNQPAPAPRPAPIPTPADRYPGPTIGPMDPNKWRNRNPLRGIPNWFREDYGLPLDTEVPGVVTVPGRTPVRNPVRNPTTPGNRPVRGPAPPRQVPIRR